MDGKGIQFVEKTNVENQTKIKVFPYMFKPKTCSNPICNKVFPYITVILSSLQFVKLQNYMFKPKTLLPRKQKNKFQSSKIPINKNNTH